MLKTTPVVFAVEDTYQIMVPVTAECLMWVQVGDRNYYDDTNGVLRSLCEVHKATVPMAELDRAGRYTLHIRPVIERGGWCSKTGEVISYEYDFTPVPHENARAYCISDTHGRTEEPIRAAQAFGEFDFLILNGDLCNCCDDVAVLMDIYTIASRLTGGNKPVVYSRGNHDLRGSHSERAADYIPSREGRTYYTFRFGSLWGAVLDCGEDKRDDHIECGNVFCCLDFRERETEYVHQMADAKTYEAEGITTRVVIAHDPFSQQLWPDYDMASHLYKQWCQRLREDVKPHVMICGHMHRTDVWYPGGQRDTYGQPCPIVLAGVPRENYHAGCGYIFGKDSITAIHTDSEGAVLRTTEIPMI